MAAPKKAALILRMPEDLHRRLVREAKKAKRSLNEEMVQRLEWTFRLTPIEERQIDYATLTDTGDDLVRQAQRIRETLQAMGRALEPTDVDDD
jgi:hypothetical protein